MPRHLRFTVPERVRVDGKPLLPLDEAALLSLLPDLEAQGVEAVAVSFLHAYANPAHEQRAAQLLAQASEHAPSRIQSALHHPVRKL